jgi:hypothetical protein
VKASPGKPGGSVADFFKSASLVDAKARFLIGSVVVLYKNPGYSIPNQLTFVTASLQGEKIQVVIQNVCQKNRCPLQLRLPRRC